MHCPVYQTHPGSGPDMAKSNTCRGFSQYFNLLKNLTPYKLKTHILLYECIL